MRTFLIILAWLLSHAANGQGGTVERSGLFSAGFMQIKEGANFGLVFSGPGLQYGMNWDCAKGARLASYRFKLGLAPLFSRGILGARFYVQPAGFSYLIRLSGGENRLYAGPVINWEYSYNLYPDLQSGFDYWFTNISLGLGARYDTGLGGSDLRLALHASLAGLTSRQGSYRDPYFYDLGFGHAIRHLHQDLTFGSFGRFLVAGFEALWRPKSGARLSLGYAMDYYGYFPSPGLTVLDHRVKMIVHKKNK